MSGGFFKVLGVFVLLIGLVCIFTYPDTPATTFDRFVRMLQSLDSPPSVLRGFSSLDEERNFFSNVVDVAKVTLSLLTYPIRFVIWFIRLVPKITAFFFVGEGL